MNTFSVFFFFLSYAWLIFAPFHLPLRYHHSAGNVQWRGDIKWVQSLQKCTEAWREWNDSSAITIVCRVKFIVSHEPLYFLPSYRRLTSIRKVISDIFYIVHVNYGPRRDIYVRFTSRRHTVSGSPLKVRRKGWRVTRSSGKNSEPTSLLRRLLVLRILWCC